MSLADGLSMSFIFSKNQILAVLMFGMVSFVSFLFIYALIFMISFLLLAVQVQEGQEELLHIQGQEVRRYPLSKVRSTGCTLLEQP